MILPCAAQLTHTVLFAIFAAGILAGPTRQMLKRACVDGDNSLSTCFRMICFANMVHLLLDLCTYAKDCDEHEHLYLWPLSDQSWHMNCIIHELFAVKSISPTMRCIRLGSEVLVHCWVWCL